MKKVELCIFDMDGLLLDTERSMYILAYKNACRDLGYEVFEQDFITSMGCPCEVHAQKIKDRFPDFPLDLYTKKFFEYVDDTIKNGYVPLRPGAEELLKYLNEKHIHTAIGTSSFRSTLDIMLGKLDALKYFEHIATRDDVKRAKPAPDIYLKAWSYFDVPKENTIVFEDATNGCISARAAGLNVIAVPDLAIIDQENRDAALYVIDRLDKAIEIIENINK